MPEPSALPRSAESYLYNPRLRALAYQVGALVLVGLLAWYLISNTLSNLEKQNIATGFDFLQKESAFEIGESLISYSSAQSYGRALLVGILNTLKVAFIGIILTVILGTFIGVARLSSNWLVSRLSIAYIEVFQNIPVLLQLFFFYAIFYELFPGPRQALEPLPGVFLCNRGLIFAVPEAHPVHFQMLVAVLAAIGIIFGLIRWARRYQARTGRAFPIFYTSILLVTILPAIPWLLAGMPLEINRPVLAGFNFRGGVTLSPEFAALLSSLVLYTAAFVAEIVRAGIQAIGRGQTEAAMSLGLKPWMVLRLIILPQAMRVIIPPLTSQMLNLTKNSSLAVAIGYPDFVSVTNTTINQTGQAIEGIALIMVVYASFSLLTSAFMNWYNKKAALVER
jgi:general L-amino acid transport system permease protein